MRAAILLAGGAGTRFGRPDKLLMPLGGRALLLHALDRARESRAARVIVAVDPRRARRVRLLRAEGVRVVSAWAAREGLGASLAAGLAALRPIEREALIFLADMPFAQAPRRLRLGHAPATRLFYRERPGHPVLVRVAAAKGVQAAAHGLAALDCVRIRGEAGNVLDIDTRAALRAARRRRR